MTYGATYPGVPHRTNKNSEAAENYASPKSAITQSKSPYFLNNRFSGFKSRCIIPFECISLSPYKMPFIILITS